jgi:hypothetical protein
MGNYGYLCNKCGLSVRGGEKAVLRHIRHGQVLGETRGTYDGYGGVDEDSIFNGSGGDVWGDADGSAIFDPGDRGQGTSAQPNSHRELWLSQFKFDDSEGFVRSARLWDGKSVDWMGYRTAAVAGGIKDLSPEMYATWEELPFYYDVYNSEPFSGVEAWHAYCFDHAEPEAKEAHFISEGDPDQSWGKPRKKYL